jgi:polyisoprenoid-binding protein YceI
MLAPTNCTRLLAIALSASLGLAWLSPDAARAAGQESASIEVHGGTVTFDAGTNVSAISVHGKSTALEGHARVHQTEQGLLAIDEVEAAVPVSTLGTGMGLRDTHMRKYVFTTSDGQTPDVRLDAGHAVCGPAGSHDMICQLSGSLAIRGQLRPFAMTLRISESGGTFRAAGDADIKLSAYQIERPSQLGVTTDDEVKLHLEFTGRPAASITAANTVTRGGR